MATKFRRAIAGAALSVAILGGIGGLESVAAVPAQVTPGAFCAKTAVGQRDRSVNGVEMECSYAAGDSRARWREAIPK